MKTRLLNIYNSLDPKYKEFLRFCIVGAFSTGLDAAIFYIVILFAPYQVALVSGYCLSLVVNYMLTMFWTFKKAPSKGNFLGVVAAHMFNLFVVRMSLMWLFVNEMSMSGKIAYIPTLAISIFTNFVLVRLAAKKL